MHRLLILLLTCLTMASAFDCDAAKPKRNSQSVKKERRAAAGEVERTRKQINQNTAETRRQLNRLASLNAEAARSGKQIDILRREIAELDSCIAVSNDSIAFMEGNLASLRRAYGDNLRAMRSRRQQMSTLALVFSASDFNEAYRRYRYMQQFEKWQKAKTSQISDLAAKLTERRDRVQADRLTQASKLKSLTDENAKLELTRGETETLVADLKRQGSSLKKALEEKQQQLKALDAELDRIIAEEARKAEEERKAEEKRLAEEAKKLAEEARNAVTKPASPEKKDPTSTPPKVKTSPSSAPVTNIALTGSFESNKGKLPFPVTGKYSIVSHFGLNSHREVSNVQVNNSGIDIETAPGSTARAVFDGEVSSVFHVNGYRNVVMLRHGNYLTVYAGLDALSVKKGDKVKAGQTLGTIYSDPEDGNRTQLHFEVRRERAKLNPEDWVK
ncbi:MAG: peptidoglycan DD-metalloendopeptidase family protein [Muribaculaceae bacterium]|nr:peptidoglycan DD-metalloendopeptidase family protein [Muribaculaceae bacterium]